MNSIVAPTLGTPVNDIRGVGSEANSTRLGRFGVAAVLLELVPLASIFFAFTNTVGAALWAADIEKQHITREGTAPKLREQAKKAE